MLKESGKRRPVTAFCSSTLELGIDLGDVAAVGQIGAPPYCRRLEAAPGA
jgi:Lhr-like helicase